MNFESTKIKTIMMEYFYGKQTTQTQNPQITSNTGKVKCMQYRKANMQDLGLAHSYQSQCFSGVIISRMTQGLYGIK